eukprot:evm.model.scf_48.21 EVM.evm.TU.scf_48.21   scf_48:158481-179062(+)
MAAPYEADHLWWTGIASLCSRLRSPAGRKAALAKLRDGLLMESSGFFRPPSDKSRAAVEGQTAVRLNGRDRQFDPTTGRSALQISECLNLDEVQSYCLLKQWMKQERLEGSMGPPTAEQLLQIRKLYLRERLSLLQATVYLLRIRFEDEPVDDDIREAVKDKIDRLLDSGLESKLFSVLEDQLSYPDSLLRWDPSAVDRPLSAGNVEISLLLKLLFLLYSHASPPCSRVVKVLQLLRTSNVFTQIEEDGPEKLTMAFLVVVGLFDFNGLLQRSAAGDGHNQVALTAESMQELDAEVELWWHKGTELSEMVILAWIVFSFFHGKTGEGSINFQKHCEVLNQRIAMDALECIAGSVAKDDCGVARAAMMQFVSGLLGFGQRSMGHALTSTVATLLEDDSALWAAVWGMQELAPVKHMVEDALAIAPAFVGPASLLLSALCSSEDSAQGVWRMISDQPCTALLHRKSHPNLRMDRDGCTFRTLGPVEAVDGSGLTAPADCVGAQHPLPPFAQDQQDVVLIKWRTSCSMAGLLLQQVWHCCNSLQKGPSATRRRCFLERLLRIMHLFSRMLMCGGVAFEEVSSDCHANTQMDFIELVCKAMDEMVANFHPELPVQQGFADSLTILRSAVGMAPTRVLDAITASRLLAPKATDVHSGVYVHVGALEAFEEKVESSCGEPVTTVEFVNLVRELIEAGLTGRHLQMYVVFIIQHILPRHKQWAYTGDAIMHDVTAGILHCIHSAFMQFGAASIADGGKAVERVLVTLCSKDGAQAFISCSLPPSIADLAGPVDCKIVESAEAAAARLLTLLPVILIVAAERDVAGPLVEAIIQGHRGWCRSSAPLLMSFVSYNSGTTNWPLLSLRFLCALASSAQQLDVTQILPPSADGPKARAALLACFDCEVAMKDPDVFMAASDFLVIAAEHHPGLLEPLLFPSKLEDAAVGAQLQEQSALDRLWGVLQKTRDLLESNPQSLYSCISAVRGLWWCQELAPQPAMLLRQQDGFWRHITECFRSDEPKSKEEHRQTWLQAAEAAALQIMTMEASSSVPANGSGQPDSGPQQGVWVELREWFSNRGTFLRTLLSKYGKCEADPEAVVEATWLAEVSAIKILMSAAKYHHRAGQHLDNALIIVLIKAAAPLLASCASDADRLQRLASEFDKTTKRKRAATKGPVEDKSGSLSELTLGKDLILAIKEMMAELPDFSSVALTVKHTNINQDRVACVIPDLAHGESEHVADLAAILEHLSTTELRQGLRLQALDALCLLISRGVQTNHVQTCMTLPNCIDLLEDVADLLRPCLKMATHDLELVLPKTPAQVAGPEGTLLHSILDHISALSTLLMDMVGWCSDGATTDWVAERREMSPSPSPMGRPRLSGVGGAGRQSGWGAPGPLEADVCLKLLRTLDTWIQSTHFLQGLRGLDTQTSDRAEEITANVLGTLLAVVCSLQATSSNADPPPSSSLTPLPSRSAGELEQLATDLLPSICALCHEGIHGRRLVGGAALSLLSIFLCRNFAGEDGVQLVFKHLEMAGLLREAAQLLRPHQLEEDEGGVANGNVAWPWSFALLHLSTILARGHETAKLLLTPASCTALLDYARELLDRCNNTDELEGQPNGRDASANGHHKMPVDTLDPGVTTAPMPRAYSREHHRRVAHRQWCMMLRIVGTLVWEHGSNNEAQDLGINFLGLGERILLEALQPPLGHHKDPLTLAWLLEVQHTTFMLCQISHLLVGRQWILPTSLKNFREAAASFVGYAASPTRMNGFSVACPPVSVEEGRSKSRTPPGDLSGPEGWFRVCLEGAETGTGTAQVGEAVSSLGPGGGGSQALVLHQGRQEGNGGPRVALSEYAWELGSTMHTATLNALMFLRLSLPAVGPCEADKLGGTWPSRHSLLALRDQCLALAHSLSADDPAEDPSNEMKWRELAGKAPTHCCGLLQTAVSVHCTAVGNQ